MINNDLSDLKRFSDRGIHDAEGGDNGGRASCLGGSPPSSLDKLALSRHRCGRSFLTIQCLACGHRHVVLGGSRDRTCPTCSKDLYERVFERYEGRVNKKNMLFLTLTMKPVKKQKPEYVRFLGKCLNKLLHRKRFRHYKGVLATVECKKTNSGWFYYHIHCLVEGSYIPQGDISQVWREISGFPIVHVKRIWRTPKRALRYVLKYILKGMNFDDSKDRADFKASFKGVRFIRSYGEFYGLEYRSSPHVYFPCPICGALKCWVVIEFCDVVDLIEDEPYWGEGGYNGG